MVEYLLFGGTTEGRILAETLEQMGKPSLVCVATEYGEKLLHPGTYVQVSCGRLDRQQMEELMRSARPRAILDATHPYAVEVSRNIAAAAEAAGISCFRVLRKSESCFGVRCFTRMEDLIEWLNTREEVVFSSLGAKEAQSLTNVRDFERRVWVRILPLIGSLQTCMEAGYPPAHVICMQGPFSVEMNREMFRSSGAGILVTKESGRAGGFEEKLEAARQCGMETAVLCRPAEESGIPLDDLIAGIREGTI